MRGTKRGVLLLSPSTSPPVPVSQLLFCMLRIFPLAGKPKYKQPHVKARKTCMAAWILTLTVSKPPALSPEQPNVVVALPSAQPALGAGRRTRRGAAAAHGH